MQGIHIRDIELKSGVRSGKWLGPLIEVDPEAAAIEVRKSRKRIDPFRHDRKLKQVPVKVSDASKSDAGNAMKAAFWIFMPMTMRGGSISTSGEFDESHEQPRQ